MSLTVLANKEDLQTHQVKFHSNQDPSAGCTSQKEAKRIRKGKMQLIYNKITRLGSWAKVLIPKHIVLVLNVF